MRGTCPVVPANGLAWAGFARLPACRRVFPGASVLASEYIRGRHLLPNTLSLVTLYWHLLAYEVVPRKEEWTTIVPGSCAERALTMRPGRWDGGESAGCRGAAPAGDPCRQACPSLRLLLRGRGYACLCVVCSHGAGRRVPGRRWEVCDGAVQ